MSSRLGSPVEIRLRGRLDDAALDRLAGAYGRVVVAETILVGDGVDQAELQGVVGLLEDLGCDLIEVRRPARRRVE